MSLCRATRKIGGGAAEVGLLEGSGVPCISDKCGVPRNFLAHPPQQSKVFQHLLNRLGFAHIPALWSHDIHQP